jgi:hypothetical protein
MLEPLTAKYAEEFAEIAEKATPGFSQRSLGFLGGLCG